MLKAEKLGKNWDSEQKYSWSWESMQKNALSWESLLKLKKCAKSWNCELEAKCWESMKSGLKKDKVCWMHESALQESGRMHSKCWLNIAHLFYVHNLNN